MTIIDERNYCVYKHTNKINGKIYIGITGQAPKNRWSNGNGYKENKEFYDDIIAYGWEDGFTHDILFNNLTADEAMKKEIELIKYYDCLSPKGYNHSRGGALGCRNTVKQYDRFTGKFIKEWESTTSVEKYLHIPNADVSAVCTKKVKTAHDFYFTYDYLGEYLPLDILTYINTNDCYTYTAQYNMAGELLHIYDTIIEARKAVGCDITQSINFEAKTSYGYIWKKSKSKDDLPLKIDQEELINILTHKNGRRCFQYTLSGKFIKAYPNTTIAAIQTNGNQSNIAAACRGDYFQSNNSLWRYEDMGYVEGNDLSSKEIKFIHKLSIPVYQYLTNGKFIRKYDSVTEASKICGIPTTNISKACTGKLKHTGGYIWRYELVEFTENELSEINKNKRFRKVSQYTLDGTLIRTYNSIAEASRITGIRGNSIASCCNHKYHHAGGYLWEYVI